MSRHYLVISDLHLSDVEDHEDGWKAYKSSRFVFDDDLALLVEDFTRRFPHDAPLYLLLNGDILDFDVVTAVPREPEMPLTRTERRCGLNPTAAKSAWKLRLILAHHPRFVETLARFLAAGHRVVYLLGNHDREFHFPAVQRVLVDALTEQAARAGGVIPPGALRFEPWFFYVPGEIYAEHGHQFDYYTAFKNQLQPTVPSSEGPLIAPPMGNLSNRYLMTCMGFFNPHASDFILNFFRYISHWVKYYLFSRRSLVFPWLWGSLLVVFRLLQLKRKLLAVRGPHAEQLAGLTDRYHLAALELKQINRIHRRPIAYRFYRVLREFWLDRLLMAGVMIGGTVVLALTAAPLWVKLMVPLCGFPLLYFIYEYLAQGESIFEVDRRLPDYARTIAELVGVKVVAFGHTHRAHLTPVAQGATCVNTGTWAPITARSDPRRLVQGTRNYLIASFADGDGQRIELGARH